MRNYINQKYCFLFALGAALVLQAVPIIAAESITLDPNTGNYVITYEGYSNGQPATHTVIYVPATKFEPSIKSEYSNIANGNVKYRYKIRNAVTSEQSIAVIRMYLREINQDDQLSPFGWLGHVFKKRSVPDPKAYIASWMAFNKNSNQSASGIMPGTTESGFGFNSRLLPGVVPIELLGSTPVHGYPDEGPGGDIGKRLNKIELNDFLKVFAAAPVISNPTTGDLIGTLNELAVHVQDLEDQNILSNVLSSDLTTKIQAAIDWLQKSNIEAANSELLDLRNLLQKKLSGFSQDSWEKKSIKAEPGKQPNTEKIAAQILLFTINYIVELR